MPRSVKAVLASLALVLAYTCGIDHGRLESTNEPATVAPSLTPVETAKREPVRHVSTRTYVTSRARKHGWTGNQWDCLNKLIWAESSWDPKSDNPNSTAYGLFQILKLKPGTPLAKQVDLGFKYISTRYGSPCKAWEFHKINHYY